MVLRFEWNFSDNVEQPTQRLCDHKASALCLCWKRRSPAWNRQTMPDVVAGNIDVFRFANRMITGLEKEAGALRGFDWALVAGRTQVLRQWRQRCHSSGRQPGREECLAAWHRYWGRIQKHLGWWLADMEEQQNSPQTTKQFTWSHEDTLTTQQVEVLVWNTLDGSRSLEGEKKTGTAGGVNTAWFGPHPIPSSCSVKE